MKKNDSDSSAKIAKNNSIDILNTDFISYTKTLRATYISCANKFFPLLFYDRNFWLRVSNPVQRFRAREKHHSLLLFAFRFRKSVVEAVCSSHLQRTYLAKRMKNRIKDSKSEILICKATKNRAAENPTQKSAERSAICPTETINDLVPDLRETRIESWIWKKKGTRITLKSEISELNWIKMN